MSKKCDTRPEKIKEVPEGVPFIQFGQHILMSTAWKQASINCRRFIDFLMNEHLNHGGYENGFLMATYNQLEEQAGISRCYIKKSIEEAVRLGFVVAYYGARTGRNMSYPNKYRLTFLKAKNINEYGKVYYTQPTNDFQRITDNKKSKSVLAKAN